VRRRSLILAACLTILIGCAGTELRLGDDIPADLGRLVHESFGMIQDVLGAHAGCLEGLTVTHSWDMEDRATYDPDSGTIVLRVPATANELEFSLAHEVAHHLEEDCPAQMSVRSAFLEAQGHPEGTPWFEGSTWEETPSEQFASALGQVVTGGPDPGRRVEVSEAALAVVAEWVEGG
jgi:hypothetical protein